MKKNGKYILMGLVLCISCNKEQKKISNWKYPYIKPDTAIDVYFGKKIIDPFRNVENLENSAVLSWFKAQREFHDSVIRNISGRESLKKEIQRFEYSSNIRGGYPRPYHNGIIFTQAYIHENIEILYKSDELCNKAVELFNTDSLNSEDSTYYSIDYYEPSYDGKYVAIGLSSGGDEFSVIHVLNTETHRFLPERIRRAYYAYPQWLANNKGFFYRQLQEANLNDSKRKIFENSSIKLHMINTDPDQDKEIFSKKVSKQIEFENIDLPKLFVYPSSNYIICTLNKGTSRYSTLYITSLSNILNYDPKLIPWVKLVTEEDMIKAFTLNGNHLYVLVYKNNPNGQLIKVNIEEPQKWDVLYEGEEYVLNEMVQSRNELYLAYSYRGIDHLIQMGFTDLEPKKISLPFKGDLSLYPDFASEPTFLNSENLYYGMSAWNKEWGIYHFDAKTEQIIKLKSRPSGPYGNPKDLTVKIVDVPSHDEKMIPLTIIHSEKLKLSGQNPVIIYAYGAYGHSIDAYFSTSRLVWYNRGGILAIAHVRGGGEKGELWHTTGMKATKSNSWKDLIACAEYLIDNKYTNPKKLAIEGASAGGITIGRALTDRPDLFQAVVIQVGSLNTMRIDSRTNRASISEYGSVKDSSEFSFLYDMDVYHHIDDNASYPATYFTAGINDSRLEAWLPGKVVARLQKNVKNGIVLFRVSDEGHFGDYDYIDELTDYYTFLFWQFKFPGFELHVKK